GLHPHQRQVFVLINAEHLGIHLLLRGEPTRQSASLELARLGKRQPVRIHYRAQGDGCAIHIEFNNRIARRRGQRRKRAQNGLAAGEAVAWQCWGVGKILRAANWRQQSQREHEGRHPAMGKPTPPRHFYSAEAHGRPFGGASSFTSSESCLSPRLTSRFSVSPGSA